MSSRDRSRYVLASLCIIPYLLPNLLAFPSLPFILVYILTTLYSLSTDFLLLVITISSPLDHRGVTKDIDHHVEMTAMIEGIHHDMIVIIEIIVTEAVIVVEGALKESGIDIVEMMIAIGKVEDMRREKEVDIEIMKEVGRERVTDIMEEIEKGTEMGIEAEMMIEDTQGTIGGMMATEGKNEVKEIGKERRVHHQLHLVPYPRRSSKMKQHDLMCIQN